MTALLVAVLIILGTMVYTVFIYALNGWVLVKMWAWFMVPWFGARPVSITEAIGLSMIVGYLTYRPDLATKENGKLAAFVGPVAHCFIVLGIAYVIHRLM